MGLTALGRLSEKKRDFFFFFITSRPPTVSLPNGRFQISALKIGVLISVWRELLISFLWALVKPFKYLPEERELLTFALVLFGPVGYIKCQFSENFCLI